jgi:hypothetical protein
MNMMDIFTYRQTSNWKVRLRVSKHYFNDESTQTFAWGSCPSGGIELTLWYEFQSYELAHNFEMAVKDLLE